MAKKAPKRTFQKPKRKLLTGGKTEYRAWGDWEEGDKIVCKLIAKQKNKKYKNKTDYVVEPVEVEFASKKETKRIENAERLTLNSMGQLDKAMKSVEVGDEIEIIYNGMNTIEGGDWEGSESHTCEVYLTNGDDEDTDEDEDDEDDEDSDDEDSDDEDSDDEDSDDEDSDDEDSDDDDEDDEEDDRPRKSKKSKSKKKKSRDDDEDEDDEDDEDSDDEDEDDEEDDRPRKSKKSKKSSKKSKSKKKKSRDDDEDEDDEDDL